MTRAEAIGSAVAFLERCRDTHVDWLDWQDATPDWRDHTTPESPGTPEHHRDVIVEYDRVIALLRDLEQEDRDGRP